MKYLLCCWWRGEYSKSLVCIKNSTHLSRYSFAWHLFENNKHLSSYNPEYINTFKELTRRQV